MIPLVLADINQEVVIKKILGTPEARLHIKELGLVEASVVKIIAKSGDNLIIQVKETRLAISSEIARKIYI